MNKKSKLSLIVLITSILSIVYVIPFYEVVGLKGGALFGYAFSMYMIFLSFFTFIPTTVSEVVDEYNINGYYEAKRRTLRLIRKIVFTSNVISCLMLFLCAELIAKSIVADIGGGNSIQDIALIIRIMTIPLLITPLLKVYRGYLDGNKLKNISTISEVIEKLLCILGITLGSFLAYKVFNQDLKTCISVVGLSFAVSGVVSYLYILIYVNKNKKIVEKDTLKVSQPKIVDNEIVKKVFDCSFPIMMLEVFTILFSTIDMFMLVKVLVDGIGYGITEAEEITSIIIFWGKQLNLIIMFIITLLVLKNVSNDIKKDVNRSVNNILQKYFFTSIPLCLVAGIISKALWITFYGTSNIGIEVYSYYVFAPFFASLFALTMLLLNKLKEYKVMIIALAIGMCLNTFLKIPLLFLFNKMKFPAYYGSITSTFLGYLVCSCIALVFIGIKYKVEIEDTIKKIINIILISLLTIGILTLIKYFIPIESSNRLINVLYILLYSGLGLIIYLGIMHKNKMFSSIYTKRTEIVDKDKNL